MPHPVRFRCDWSKMNETALTGAVLVTGASSGIGRASARMLAARGLHVFAGVRHVESAHSILAGTSGTITPVTLDVTSEEDTARVVDEVRKRLPGAGLVGLVNCAGIGLSGPLEHVSRAAINQLFDVNVVGQLATIQAFLPLLRTSGGRIVNVGSTSGKIPGALNGAYCASKFALEALTSVLRAELASSGIRVVMIQPGVVATPFWEKMATAELKLTGKLPAESEKTYGRVLARRQQDFAVLRESGQSPDHVCRAILHALSSTRPKRRYVVGRDARLKLALWGMLPEWVRDRIARRGMRG